MIHPLALAYLEAQAAYVRALPDSDATFALASDRAYDAWIEAGCPIKATEPAPPPPNTVKVRIAVSVDSDKRWLAAGGSGHDWSDPVALRTIKHDPQHDRLSFITAHVPLPEPAAEIVGEVSNG